jgi:hypothetical protein
MVLATYQVNETMIMLYYNELMMQMIHNLYQHLQLQRKKTTAEQKKKNKELFNFQIQKSLKIVLF